MTQATLKTAMAGLLVATGVFHLIVALTGEVGELKLGLILFGVAYFLTGIFLFPGRKIAVQVAMVLTFLGLGLGGVSYLRHGGPPGIVVMFVIDVVVLALGGLWLAKNMPAR